MPPNVGEVRKPLRAEKPARVSCWLPAASDGVDLRRERGALHRDLAVALDEHEQDVLAAQAGEQALAGGVAEAVVADLAAKTRVVVERRLHGVAPRRRRGRRRSWRRSARRRRAAARNRSRDPGEAERRDGQRRRARGGRPRPGSAAARARAGITSAATTARPMPTTIRSARRAADRVAQRLDADAECSPVLDRVERPVEGREEPEVEDLHDDQQAEHRPDDARPGRAEAGGAGRGDER